MTVEELSKKEFFRPAVMPCGEREISGVYIGDLLSWVMGRALSGDAWITIMSNKNILAVASLADCSCIIVAEDVTLDPDVLDTAGEKDINILYYKNSIYDAAVCLSGLI